MVALSQNDDFQVIYITWMCTRSHVLKVIGINEEYVKGTNRISLVKYSTEDDVGKTVWL